MTYKEFQESTVQVWEPQQTWLHTFEGLENIDVLKDEQMIALKAFIEKQDVFAILSTGYGKSLIYQLARLVGKKFIFYYVMYYVKYVADCGAPNQLRPEPCFRTRPQQAPGKQIFLIVSRLTSHADRQWNI